MDFQDFLCNNVIYSCSKYYQLENKERNKTFDYVNENKITVFNYVYIFHEHYIYTYIQLQCLVYITNYTPLLNIYLVFSL